MSGTRTYPFRPVRPHERAWPDERLLHAVIDDLTTGCGIPIPDPTAAGRACDFPRFLLCPNPNCFGASS